jgi:exodeoxyribonuclease VII small subunit
MAKLSFEKAMEQLERIVHELESGDLSLEKALKQFEEGIQLSRQCAEKLDESEKKINLLMEQADGTLSSVPFDPDDPPKAG